MADSSGVSRRPLSGLLLAAALLTQCVNGGPREVEKRVDGTNAVSGKSSRAVPAAPGQAKLEWPPDAIHASVCGIHFYSGDLERQVVAHHYCSHLSSDVLQCVIYDSPRRDARLIGVEYIVSESVFKGLPEEERKLWHSHAYEVKSGLLMSLGMPAGQERELMKGLMSTYGKTWHFWQVDRGDTLPLGTPRLMMGFTADGQARRDILEKRDHEFGVSTSQSRKAREAFPEATVAAGADSWTRGEALQLELRRQKGRRCERPK